MKIITILFILLISINIAQAWNSKTHQSIVEELYYSIPYELESRLDLEKMKNGSTSPDLIFHDQRTHHYPTSYNKTIEWLNKTKEQIKNNDYENASYSFGVVTHYISDSFVGPHYISKEDAKLHTKFEYQINTISAKCNNSSFDINKTLEKASIDNQQDWYSWLKTKNKEIPEKELDEAMNLLFPLFLETFNTSCEERKTEIIYEPFSFNPRLVIYLAIMIMLMITIIKLKLSKN